MAKISQYNFRVKVNAIELSDEKGVEEAARILNIPEGTILSWRKRMRGSDPKFSVEDKKKALLLRAEGASYRSIAKALGVSVSTAHSWVKELSD